MPSTSNALQPLTASIVEDEEIPRDTLTTLLARYCPNVNIVSTAETVVEGARAARAHQPDIMFLDVELEDGDCFELLDDLKGERPNIIITTAHSHYAIPAIKRSALDYLLKPILVSELKAAVAKAARSAPQRRERPKSAEPAPERRFGSIALPTFDGYELVDAESIIRLEAQGNYTAVYLGEPEPLIVCKLIQHYEDLLRNDFFVRVHKAHLVNLRHVKKYIRGQGGYAVLSDGSTVDVSIRRREAFLERLRRA